jgi:hypothetical protein
MHKRLRLRLDRCMIVAVAFLALVICCLPGCHHFVESPPDDAMAAGYTAADFLQLKDDLFKQMDQGLHLTEDEIEGRNTWILWTAGNQVFWDRIAREGYGIVDLLKTLDSRNRAHRFATMGLINEPGFRLATNPDQYGLWLDQKAESSPTASEPDEKTYGRSSGVIGLRIYSNPDFDEQAKKRWDARRYYSDRAYFTDRSLIRPYRVGVTCGLCHVAPNPLNPPGDPENPGWQNLDSAIGNQYFREGKVFAFDEHPGSFFWEMLNAQPPGTSDTSRVANDHINNPSSINPIFDLKARLAEGVDETIAGGARDLLTGFDEITTQQASDALIRNVPHILKDGADSVGVVGAVMRVYVNEGLDSQQWLTDHDLLLGLKRQRPFSVAQAARTSVYWQATFQRAGNIAKFFSRIKPMHLEDAPGGRAYITSDEATMDRGKQVFGEHCASCHSSKQPPAGIAANTPAVMKWYRESAKRRVFREDNFLSNERRYPVSLIRTNACRAFATNATTGHIWDNFSSLTYKSLPSIDAIEMFNPVQPSKPLHFMAPGGGPGYYRPPSLISIWSSAPFLHNNSIGIFTGDPSVAGRMRAFNDGIEKLLWPEKRDGEISIRITKQPSFLRIPQSFLPEALKTLCVAGFLNLGPIPKGTPINLVANFDPKIGNLLKLLPSANLALLSANQDSDFAQLTATPTGNEKVQRLVSDLLSLSNCPDLIEDRGHYFGTELSDSDKLALIEFLKTL